MSGITATAAPPETQPARTTDGHAPLRTPVLYDAVITHARSRPVHNRFRYRTHYWLIDTDAPPHLARGLGWLGRIDAADHVDVRALLAEHGMHADRVYLLAHPRVLGYVFNPISLYWCYRDGDPNPTVIAEVHNTYGGRHAYLLDPDDNGRAVVDKRLYVSPFYPVDGSYQIRVSPPGERLLVTVTLHRDGDAPFVATLTARRRPATPRALSVLALRHPRAPLRTSVLIRWHGFSLWLR